MSRTRPRRPRPSRSGELRPHDASLADAATPCLAVIADSKSLQLCAQARRALEYAMGECRDEALTDLFVVEVLPDPTTRRLRVWLCGPAAMDSEDRELRLQRLTAARGFLRAQVASAIHRKRTPELVFELLSSEGDAEGRTT